ncbi:MAG: outer membrane protein [Candidatus Acidiferrales bacterium]
MKRSLFFAGCLAVVALAAAPCAQAADLSLAPLYKAPPPVSPAYDWSGFYLGVNGGGGWGDSHWQGIGRAGLSGGQLGGTAGYNWQLGQAVLGLEGDIDWSHLTGNVPCAGGTCTTSDTWLSTVRGRVGYSFDRFLPYVTGGLASGNIGAAAPGLPGGSTTNTGWALGGGVEVALPGNWSAKAEYLHVDLGAFNCGVACGAPNENVSMRDDIFRAGVNYHFGWAK